jgi:hypothetical protein
LESSETTEDIDQLLQSIWQNQENQELAVDIHADLADQIDAEIAAIKTRMQYLTELHSKAINKLQRWRERLDQTVLYGCISLLRMCQKKVKMKKLVK